MHSLSTTARFDPAPHYARSCAIVDTQMRESCLRHQIIHFIFIFNLSHSCTYRKTLSGPLGVVEVFPVFAAAKTLRVFVVISDTQKRPPGRGGFAAIAQALISSAECIPFNDALPPPVLITGVPFRLHTHLEAISVVPTSLFFPLDGKVCVHIRGEGPNHVSLSLEDVGNTDGSLNLLEIPNVDTLLAAVDTTRSSWTWKPKLVQITIKLCFSTPELLDAFLFALSHVRLSDFIEPRSPSTISLTERRLTQQDAQRFREMQASIYSRQATIAVLPVELLSWVHIFTHCTSLETGRFALLNEEASPPCPLGILVSLRLEFYHVRDTRFFDHLSLPRLSNLHVEGTLVDAANIDFVANYPALRHLTVHLDLFDNGLQHLIQRSTPLERLAGFRGAGVQRLRSFTVVTLFTPQTLADKFIKSSPSWIVKRVLGGCDFELYGEAALLDRFRLALGSAPLETSTAIQAQSDAYSPESLVVENLRLKAELAATKDELDASQERLKVTQAKLVWAKKTHFKLIKDFEILHGLTHAGNGADQTNDGNL
ncbi:hypothetical protein C8R46DRAFT_1219296 [Mycena filopes]|nr:hypothetical protein C8R46DRAFT_1219296 [Mycena filopes]